MIWNRIADRAVVRFRRRQIGNHANQNEYDNNGWKCIFHHILHLDYFYWYSLLFGILDCITGTAGIAVENRNQFGGMVDKPLISILIDIR